MRPFHVVRSVLATAGVVLLSGCRGGAEPDAYGNFEATEVVVSAQTSGQIREMSVSEGMQIPLGAVAAVIDTTQLALEREQIISQRNVATSRGTEVAEQLRVLAVQRDIAQRAYERTRRLHDVRAATTQQLEQAEREYRTLTAQMAAVRAQREGAAMNVTSTEARVAQIADLIAKSVIRNPHAGTVLATYARAGEVVQAGQPLYRIADLEVLELRAYVTGDQLPAIRVGQQAEVHVGSGDDEILTLPGTVMWISPTAEFTPTPIQTREERSDLVYGVKVRVANRDGILKIGMPGDVTFTADPGKQAP